MNRYEKYKDSGITWIGEIPEHWETRRIKSFSIVKRGASPRPIDDEKYFDAEGEFAWVRIADVSASNRYLLATTQRLSKLGESLSVKQYPNDIFLSIAGTVGKSIITRIKCCIHDGFVWFKGLEYNRELMSYIFDSGQPYLGLGKMGTQLNLNTDTVGNISFPFPSPSEQAKIAEYLDWKCGEVDKIVAVREEQIKLLGELRTSVISRAVTKGLNPDAPLKDSGISWIGSIPAHWEVVKLKFIGKINGRVGYRGYTTDDLVRKGEGAYTIGGKHISKNILDLTDAEYISWHKYYESPEIMVKKGDIVIAQRGSLGKSALINKEIGCATINPSLVLLNAILINNFYLHYWLISDITINTISLLNTATAVPMISQNQIENMSVMSPPLAEQQAIADYLDKKTAEIDSAVAKYKEQIAKLKEYRGALITEVVTGKIDVRDVVIPKKS
ncbi:MAG: restriction endonuclease subunit S [Rikenellaceae bacterium]